MATTFLRGDTLYARYKDASDKWQSRTTGTSDPKVAQRIADDFEAEARLRRSGKIDTREEAIADESKRSIELHLLDYATKLRNAGDDPKHILSTMTYIRLLAEHGGCKRPCDITADKISRAADKLREQGLYHTKGQAEAKVGPNGASLLDRHYGLHQLACDFGPAQVRTRSAREYRQAEPEA